MNYHPTNDYPINLENVFKMIGFANKGNGKRTLENNFTKDEDYKKLLFHREKNINDNEGGNSKTLLFPREKQKHTVETRGGHNKEDVMLNIDTFKNLCMLAKTEKGKQIRKYYVKLENVYNEIIMEEIEQNKRKLQEQQLFLKIVLYCLVYVKKC